ncbi:hypothetical protein Salat_2131700 [Sesamum alatum]|uniref:Uncharacterized protein n=1 Tax=Sesamum alatum TaxID=300844 RepID=A0AAE1Y114_9LAMI|nr:hypothetical protein Salat_2131700 [Sesamum alatum]
MGIASSQECRKRWLEGERGVRGVGEGKGNLFGQKVARGVGLLLPEKKAGRESWGGKKCLKAHTPKVRKKKGNGACGCMEWRTGNLFGGMKKEAKMKRPPVVGVADSDGRD